MNDQGLLSKRERRVAALAAMRLPIEEIAQDMDLTLRTVERILARPEVTDLILHYRAQSTAATSGNVLAEIEQDTRNTFTRLKQLRDQDLDLKTALGASRELWSVQVPKRTHHDETHVTKIIIERRDLDRMRQVREELKTITAEAVDVTPTETAAEG